MLDIVDHFLWVLRREGFTISTAQAIDVARAASEVGFADKSLLRDAIGCVVVDSSSRRTRYQELFEEFFAHGSPRPVELAHRLLAQGFSRAELAALRDLLRDFSPPESRARLRALLTGGWDLDQLLASDAVQRLIARIHGPLQKGFYAHQLFDEIGVDRARSALDVLREGLGETLSPVRAELLIQALTRELDRSEHRVREQIERRLDDVAERAKLTDGAMSLPFASLTEDEMIEVRRGVRLLAERLRGAARVKRRHKRRGRIDAARTMRKGMTTGGVPFRIVRRDQRRDRPRLVVLCDVSDSVRAAARFMLEFVYAVQELFDRTRSFVFVSELAEVTSLFQEEGVAAAVAKAAATTVNTRENSSYARALRAFERNCLGAVDRRTTVVILGDGRTNYQPDGAEIVKRMRERAKSVLWLCPEPRANWGMGDSAMPAYAEAVTQALVVSSGRDLEQAAREIIVRG